MIATRISSSPSRVKVAADRRAPGMPPPPALLPELLPHIQSYLLDSRDLISASLVSQSWCYAAQARLVLDVRVSTGASVARFLEGWPRKNKLGQDRRVRDLSIDAPEVSREWVPEGQLVELLNVARPTGSLSIGLTMWYNLKILKLVSLKGTIRSIQASPQKTRRAPDIRSLKLANRSITVWSVDDEDPTVVYESGDPKFQLSHLSLSGPHPLPFFILRSIFNTSGPDLTSLSLHLARSAASSPPRVLLPVISSVLNSRGTRPAAATIHSHTDSSDPSRT